MILIDVNASEFAGKAFVFRLKEIVRPLNASFNFNYQNSTLSFDILL